MRRYSNTSGFSIRTIKRFCADKNIHRTSRLNEDELDEVVSQSVRMVCHTHTHMHLVVLGYLFALFTVFMLHLYDVFHFDQHDVCDQNSQQFSTIRSGIKGMSGSVHSLTVVLGLNMAKCLSFSHHFTGVNHIAPEKTNRGLMPIDGANL